MPAILAEEGHEHGAEYVERGHAGGDHADPVHPGRMMVGGDQNLVLAEEAGKWRDARDRHARRRTASQKVIGMFFRRPPMWRMSCSPFSAWITLPAPRNSSALKNACVIRWKMPAENAPTPSAEEHVAELGDRRVGEDLLDVVLRQADGRGEERPWQSDDRDHFHGHRRVDEERAERATM